LSAYGPPPEQLTPDVDRFRVCGVDIAVVTPQEAADTVLDHAAAHKAMQVHLCNAYTLSLVDRDARLREVLRSADLNLSDGTPLSWFGRSRGMRGPVRGPALVGDVARAGVERGVRHHLWGGAPGVAEEMAVGLRRHAPGVQIVGTECPAYRVPTAEDLDQLVASVTESEADVLWIGIGTPKQDYIVPELAERLSIPVVPVGAAFDFWSGAVSEAPHFLHGSGLEWVYRLAREPRRLWKRYLLGNPRFLWSAFRHRAR
jgi:N-acetylglucosaminyldiphosphoundecaprenol N-acetyl-beta-D-mannosaminyltransferase